MGEIFAYHRWEVESRSTNWINWGTDEQRGSNERGEDRDWGRERKELHFCLLVLSSVTNTLIRCHLLRYRYNISNFFLVYSTHTKNSCRLMYAMRSENSHYDFSFHWQCLVHAFTNNIGYLPIFVCRSLSLSLSHPFHISTKVHIMLFLSRLLGSISHRSTNERKKTKICQSWFTCKIM